PDGERSQAFKTAHRQARGIQPRRRRLVCSDRRHRCWRGHGRSRQTIRSRRHAGLLSVDFDWYLQADVGPRQERYSGTRGGLADLSAVLATIQDINTSDYNTPPLILM